MNNIEFNSIEVMKKVNQCGGYGRLTGIEITYAKDGCACAQLVLDERHFNPIGSIHGGCIFTLADTVAGTAAATNGTSVTTLSAHSVFLNAAMAGKTKVLFAKAEPVRVGRKIAVYKVIMTDDLDREIAEFTFEFFRMSQAPGKRQ